jgi:hypothetical protein
MALLSGELGGFDAEMRVAKGTGGDVHQYDIMHRSVVLLTRREDMCKELNGGFLSGMI